MEIKMENYKPENYKPRSCDPRNESLVRREVLSCRYFKLNECFLAENKICKPRVELAHEEAIAIEMSEIATGRQGFESYLRAKDSDSLKVNLD